MCLDRVSTTYDEPSGLIMDGWKEFRGPRDSPTFYYAGGPVQLDTWLRASGHTMISSDGGRYQAGFHIYSEDLQRRRAVQRSAWRRVYFRNATCEGFEDDKKVVIAQEMYVPSDRNGWPPLEAAPPGKKRLFGKARK